MNSEIRSSQNFDLTILIMSPVLLVIGIYLFKKFKQGYGLTLIPYKYTYHGLDDFILSPKKSTEIQKMYLGLTAFVSVGSAIFIILTKIQLFS